MISRLRCPSLLVLIAVGVLSPACHRTPAGAVKRFGFTGRVISVDTQSQTAVIDGDKVAGFMDAMAMSYKIKPASVLAELKPGDSISAEVVVQSGPNDAASDYWLEHVTVTAHAKTQSHPASGVQRVPAPGDKVPDFQLTNQDGRAISLRQYRGKVLLVTFIYTRCPFPDFCPRVTANFAEIYKQIAADPALVGHVHLLCVSFDPEHDTPKVLRAYAFSAAHTHDRALFKSWEFAVPSPRDLPSIADFFALTYKPEAGLITHDLSTAVIAPDGTIARWYHGSDWQISDLIKDASDALGRAS